MVIAFWRGYVPNRPLLLATGAPSHRFSLVGHSGKCSNGMRPAALRETLWSRRSAGKLDYSRSTSSMESTCSFSMWKTFMDSPGPMS